MALHPFAPMVICGHAGGGMSLARLVGISLGPFVVTAIERNQDLTLRCPACREVFQVGRERLGTEATCPLPTCGARLRINPFVLQSLPRRNWSGTEWIDERRARPVVAEPATPPVSEAQHTRNMDEAEARETPATSRKKFWRLGWPPLAEVVDGIHSDDTATRIKAAAQLQWARRSSDAAGRLTVEIACLDDPVPEVRFYALQALVVIKQDRKWLLTLLLSGQQADAARKASVLARIAEMLGTDSPFHGGPRLLLQPLVLKRIFNVVLDEDRSAATTLPVLEVARTLGLTPKLFTPLVRDPATNAPELPAFHWPDRCCVCGRPHPQGSKPLPFSFSWEWSGDREFGTTTMTGSLPVPACVMCHALPSPQADLSGLRMCFSSPAFVAELLEQGTWTRAESYWTGC